MAAIAVELGTDGLSEVIKSLSVTLMEGYQLHLRSATIHSVLLKLSDAYIPMQETTNHLPEFDTYIPSLMDLVLQDMFGVVSERREDGDISRHLIKEVVGTKYLETVEIICRLLYFRPSASIDKSVAVRRSSIHTVVAPFFEKLKSDGIIAFPAGSTWFRCDTSKVPRIRLCPTSCWGLNLASSPNPTRYQLPSLT
jgi:U3 small nucleolar RNA-associated protein 20